jgi:hypothetical protein
VVLAGTVVEEQTDRPLARAVVLADPHGQVTQGQAVTTVTDADGRFQLEVESGRYRVSARVDGFSSATTEVEIDGASVTDLRLPLGRGGIIRGRVVDARGRAAGDGVVRAFSATTGAGAATAPLLPDGRFELSGLAEGEYALAARSDAGGFALRAGVATGADEVTLVLRGGGRVQAKLVGPDGAPVAGASVSVFRVDGALFPGIAGGSVSDRDGLAVIASPAGAVEIRAARLEGPVLESGGTSIVVVEEGGTAAAEVVLEKPATALPPD